MLQATISAPERPSSASRLIVLQPPPPHPTTLMFVLSEASTASSSASSFDGGGGGSAPRLALARAGGRVSPVRAVASLGSPIGAEHRLYYKGLARDAVSSRRNGAVRRLVRAIRPDPSESSLSRSSGRSGRPTRWRGSSGPPTGSRRSTGCARSSRGATRSSSGTPRRPGRPPSGGFRRPVRGPRCSPPTARPKRASPPVSCRPSSSRTWMDRSPPR